MGKEARAQNRLGGRSVVGLYNEQRPHGAIGKGPGRAHEIGTRSQPVLLIKGRKTLATAEGASESGPTKSRTLL